MKLKPSSYFLIGILVVALFAVINSLMFARLKMQLVPLTMGGLIFVLAAIELFRELKQKQEVKSVKESNSDSEQTETKGQLKSYIIIFCWLIGFLAGIYLLGFIVAIAIFIFSYLKWYGHTWIKSIGLAATATIIIYIMFITLMKFDLFPGILPGLILES